eukprot:6162110-Amphidinium_carterae.1
MPASLAAVQAAGALSLELEVAAWLRTDTAPSLTSAHSSYHEAPMGRLNSIDEFGDVDLLQQLAVFKEEYSKLMVATLADGSDDHRCCSALPELAERDGARPATSNCIAGMVSKCSKCCRGWLPVGWHSAIIERQSAQPAGMGAPFAVRLGCNS